MSPLQDFVHKQPIATGILGTASGVLTWLLGVLHVVAGIAGDVAGILGCLAAALTCRLLYLRLRERAARGRPFSEAEFPDNPDDPLP